MIQTFSAPLLQAKLLAKDVYQYDFEGQVKDFKAGQFILIEVKDENEKKVTRAYSLVSSPLEENVFSLCVKLLPDGRASEYLKHMPIGMLATFQGPFGHFLLKDSPHPIVMVCTGTGLAPFMSMLPVLFHQNFSAPIHLYFGVRKEEDLFYLDQLKAWEEAHPTFKTFVTLSQASESWTGLRGRVTEHLENLEIDGPATEIYICGNGDMVKGVKTLMEGKSIPRENLHFELYSPA